MVRFEKLDDYVCPAKDEKPTCMEYGPGAANHEEDVMFMGTSQGIVQLLYVRKGQSKVEDISRGQSHDGPVTCLTYISQDSSLKSKYRFVPEGVSGLLFSGSQGQGLIKVWEPCQSESKDNLVQTLYGHGGTITAIANGKRGNIISASLNGVFKVWQPQRGRDMMKYPYFECCFSHCASPSGGGGPSWFGSLAISLYPWTLFVGTSKGSVEVWGTEQIDLEIQFDSVPQGGGIGTGTGQLQQLDVWVKFHKLGVNHLLVDDSLRYVPATAIPFIFMSCPLSLFCSFLFYSSQTKWLAVDSIRLSRLSVLATLLLPDSVLPGC
jgi:WD40 repeat protein